MKQGKYEDEEYGSMDIPQRVYFQPALKQKIKVRFLNKKFYNNPN